ncbi:DNA-formamidopyrimidine glycosylase family protein [Actinocrispum sp. NPDC049592]|uniref:DNA-formamidopyrimidine glycosylase family protein n=1 Tax=Actinocrispum sp. NPDC049592 TaxID=3154835 RepID=UPI00344A9390
MPEGDTVYYTGLRLTQALAGKVLRRGELRHPRLSTVDLAGRTVEGVRTYGKHIFVRFDKDLSLHNHLMMDGSWQIHATGQRWHSPAHHVRAILANDDHFALGVRLHDMELLRTKDEDARIAHLGPDLLGENWDPETAAQALAARPDREIGLALLDQTVMAGVGNVYKAEVCFLLGVSPWAKVSEVDARRAVDLSHELLTRNATTPSRNTTGLRRPATWVYGQRQCRKCGGRIQVADQGTGLEIRKTWFCPVCQRRNSLATPPEIT